MNELLAHPTLLTIKVSVWSLITFIFAYLNISSEAFLILIILMVFDFASGVAKSYALSIDIASERFWYGLIKKVLTLMAIISIALLLKLVEFDARISMTILMALFATGEVFSMVQNIVAYHTRTPISEFNATKFVLEKVLEILRTKIEK